MGQSPSACLDGVVVSFATSVRGSIQNLTTGMQALDKPTRIQRRRTKGWRLPPNTVVVSRPSRWGNPYRITKIDGIWFVEKRLTGFQLCIGTDLLIAVDVSLNRFRNWLRYEHELIEQARTELRGKNLACWCPLDRPCHADVWLEVVNG